MTRWLPHPLCDDRDGPGGSPLAGLSLCRRATRLRTDRIRIPDPDTDLVPYDTRTTSSRSTYMMGRALTIACQEALLDDGQRGYGEIENQGGLDPDTGQGLASTHWHQAAAAAHLEVDEESGVVHLHRLHCAVYAGRVVNRPGAELQTEGSMCMGLGSALFEELVLDQGQVTNANLSDYNVPTAEDTSAITHELIERAGAPVHGLGETALPPVPPAIGNALAELGIELHELPMTPERVLGAVDRRSSARLGPIQAGGRRSAVRSCSCSTEPRSSLRWRSTRRWRMPFTSSAAGASGRPAGSASAAHARF